MSSIVLTHGDCDGVCSGAIVKRALDRPDVFFTSPVSLLGDLNNLTGTYDNIVICDIAIDERTYPELEEKLNELAEVSDIFYIDHHPLPVKKFSADWFYHDECSTAEMAYTLFSRKMNRDMRRVAIYGAIGEFAETPVIQKWERDWDKRTLYFFAGTLIQGIIEAGRNYDYKRQILNALSLDTPPPEIEGLLDSAIVASKKEEHIMGLVREKVVRLRNLAYVVDINGYMSKAAIYAASYGNCCVGVSCEYRQHKHVYDMSIRSRGCDVDLNTILRTVAVSHGGTGGGHHFAGGARIPGKQLEAFLYDFDDALGR
ncbi:DHH family phosphoesterase [Candidatus Methanoperedens nitratireducens]|uniref:Phosphoesterase DHHA1 n=1 Tax=Candidatus Methanoperedens nitratireducens TaxID=1392998 RepID=A0A284VTV2_9EURY|nr:DHHA1 domain-containing protein [Candidatus Methanoperedens nitroreducens]SNQ62639.1 Phosphoesterase DHHA1 [Candidatus Methanoperedens nitroreducens]